MSSPAWPRLLRIARSLIHQVNSEHQIVSSWSLGGGTAMMIRIAHRRSDDIDIFLPDPQFLPYFDPKLHDFEFEIRPADYQGDGFNFLKLAFPEIGEIDFIVGDAMTDPPTTRQIVDGEPLDLETIAEIVAKKIHYRGAHIKPRDIFDIAVAARYDRKAVVDGLRSHKSAVATVLAAIDRLNPDFVRATIEALAINDPYLPLASTALEDARGLLRSV